MRNYSDAGQDRVCVHGAATSSRRSTSLSRAWLRDVCKPRENCGGLGQQGPGIRANMLRYHILTHALDSQRLNLPSGRINQAGASWQREQGGTEGGEQILRESSSWLATSATQRGRRCQGPSRTRTSTRLRCLRRWRKRIPTMTTCEHPAVAKAGFMRAGAWRPWATTSCCG